MNRSLKFLIAIGIGLASTGGQLGAAADAPPEQRAAPAPTPQEIRGWIENLASNRFEIREAATKQLEKAGSAAVQPLSEAAQRDSLEVTCRAIRALEAIADRSDVATFESAQIVLEQLAGSTNRSVVRRAELALRGLGRARRRHAIIRITELGAVVKTLLPASSTGIIVPREDENAPIQIILNKRWKGGDEGLVHLRRIDGYHALYVTRGAPISPKALEELERDLPVKVQFRGEAMLGVMCQDVRAECVIDRVSPGTAAEKAGLEAGDTIVKYDGEEITMFQRLIEITNSHNAGDKVAIEIIRDGKAMKLEAVLTEWQ